MKATEGYRENERSRRLPNFKALFRGDSNLKEQFTEEEESQLNLFNKGLYDFLNETCLLCGKETIKGTQIPFAQQNSIEWEIV